MDVPNLITGTLCRLDTTNTSCYSRIMANSQYFSVGAAFVSVRLIHIGIHDITEVIITEGTQYRISIKFGGELNLANWRFVTNPPNLNFVNIYTYILNSLIIFFSHK